MPSNVDLSDDPLVAQSREAAEAMETEAAAFFAAKAATAAAEPLNPVAPALERAATAPAKEAKAAPAKPAAPKGDAKASKVAGAPSLAKPSVASAPASAEPKASDPAATTPAPAANDASASADFSDVPRTYKPGEMRGRNWDRLHAKSDHFESLATQRAAEAQQLRAELEQLRSASTSAAPSEEIATRITALQSERDSLRTQLQAVAGERIFDTESKPRRDAALLQAKQVAGPEHAERIAQLLAMSESSYRDNALEELIATLPPLRAAKLTAAVADLDRLTAERAAAAAQGGELFQRRVAEATAAQERENQARIARASSTFDAEAREWEPVGLTPDELASARSVYSGQGATLQDAARAALWAVAGPRAAAQLNAANERVAELEAQLAKLQSARPSLGAGATGALPASNGADEDDPSITSYAERIAREAARAGVRFGVAS